MKRLWFILITALVLSLSSVGIAQAAVLSNAPPQTSAQFGTPMPVSGFVGAWRVTVTPTKGPAFVNLSTYGADGTVLNSGAPVMPVPGAPSKQTLGSTGHGAWLSTGADTADVVFVVLQSDQAGNFLGTVTVQATLRLGSDDETWDGTFMTTIADPAGKVMAQFSGKVHATRITVQSMGAPATPVA